MSMEGKVIAFTNSCPLWRMLCNGRYAPTSRPQRVRIQYKWRFFSLERFAECSCFSLLFSFSQANGRCSGAALNISGRLHTVSSLCSLHSVLQPFSQMSASAKMVWVKSPDSLQTTRRKRSVRRDPSIEKMNNTTRV